MPDPIASPTDQVAAPQPQRDIDLIAVGFIVGCDRCWGRFPRGMRVARHFLPRKAAQRLAAMGANGLHARAKELSRAFTRRQPKD